jgi:shikimate kinase
MHRESIILIGMPASGKSTVGKLLAKELGYRFIDLDVYIQEKDGRSLQDIIDTEGEAALMDIEKKSMSELNLYKLVVAPGGSLVYYADLMQELKKKALIVYLNESLSGLEKRLGNAPTRGIIGLKHKSLAGLYTERAPLYMQYADIVIDSDNLTCQQITSEIIEKIGRPEESE